MKPILVNLQKESIDGFRKHTLIDAVIDRYDALLEEIFLIRNPRYRFDENYARIFEAFCAEHYAGKSTEEAGNWFYFPWNKLLIHYLSDAMHQELRSARNKNLITKKEQEEFYNFPVGIAGLSVGSHAALTLVMMAGARVMKLADPDEISGSNLNRIRTDFSKVGLNKCDVVTEHIYQVNPYAEIYAYRDGVTIENLTEFLAGPPRLGVLIECLDNLELKIRLRLEARRIGIPVIMATDNGDGIIFDTERYDLDPNLQLFNGVAGDLTLEEFQQFAPQELPRLATKLAGSDVVVPRMLQSVSEVGRTLYSWPQLGDAATLSGVALAYVVKQLALGRRVKTGKLEINLDAIFDPDYSSPEESQKRQEQRKAYLRDIGIE